MMNSNTALLVIDMQIDFLPGGALAVPEGDRIVPLINKLMPAFPLVVATQDWHPPNHASFASNHPDKMPGDVIQLHGQDQVLWPDHCVQGTDGAAFAPGLDVRPIEAIFRKGMDPNVDSYSGFYDNGHRKDTGLAAFLRGRGINHLYLCGLATDFCVNFSAQDALQEGFQVTLIQEASRAVNLLPAAGEQAIAQMESMGVQIG